jgi:crotonobetainyl-CoA:carnitine CoA-transferase CaiB-like acyl-CoA transferase
MEKLCTEMAIPDRSDLNTQEIIADIWKSLDLPATTLSSVQLTGHGSGLPSSFKVGALAQATIAVSALSAALVHSARNSRRPENHDGKVPTVSVDLDHAVTEFTSERYLRINGKPVPFDSYPIGGLHRVKDGWVRIHDGFPHHRSIALGLLGLDESASKKEIEEKLGQCNALELQERGMQAGCVIVKLQSFVEWDVLPQAQNISDMPVRVRRIQVPGGILQRLTSPFTKEPVTSRENLWPETDKCLRGIRVLDFSRVIAAPVAGRVLAAHGADVLWITAPHLPDLPPCDRDTARGKRSIQLDLRQAKDKQVLMELVKDADVVLQGYRPDALKKLELGWEECVSVNPDIVYANLSAWGDEGPWCKRRGFDSIVQAASGINVAEAEAYGRGDPSKVLPCQALDHGSGYFLASGICAALYKREKEGGAWKVDVSLAGTGKYLRSLGRIDAFDCAKLSKEETAKYLETKMSGFGMMTGLKHAAKIESLDVGWDFMPEPLGSDEAKWLRKTGCDA